MSPDTISYTQRRVRKVGNREWELWLAPDPASMAFKMRSRDQDGDWREALVGVAHLVADEDLFVKEDDSGTAYFADRYHFEAEAGKLDIFVEVETEELVWVFAQGEYADSLGLDVPLMPAVAG